jgi:hypothetical protein
MLLTSPKKSVPAAARARGIEISIHQIGSAEGITAAIDAAKASGTEGLNVLASPFLYGNRQIVKARADKVIE